MVYCGSLFPSLNTFFEKVNCDLFYLKIPTLTQLQVYIIAILKFFSEWHDINSQLRVMKSVLHEI